MTIFYFSKNLNAESAGEFLHREVLNSPLVEAECTLLRFLC